VRMATTFGMHYAVFVSWISKEGMEKIHLLISLLYSEEVNRFFLLLFIHGRGEQILLLHSFFLFSLYDELEDFE
jgi:hypothetical protein